MYKSISVLTLLTGIIAVDVVLAQSTVNLPIRVKQGESYEGLLTRASQLAEKTIISRFNQQQGLNKIDLLITAEKSGAIAPLLAVKVPVKIGLATLIFNAGRMFFPLAKISSVLALPHPSSPRKVPPLPLIPVHLQHHLRVLPLLLLPLLYPSRMSRIMLPKFLFLTKD